MFLVRTDPRNANRNSLAVGAQFDNHNEGFKGIKSYIQIGDSEGFLSEKKLNSGQQTCLLVLLRSIFKSTRLTSRYDFHIAQYIN